MKKIKIFLASSAELDRDKELFEIYISKKNKEWSNRNVFLELLTWKDFIDAISKTRLQDDYNDAIRESDIFVVLFHTKLGRYTSEEFDTAYNQFRKSFRGIKGHFKFWKRGKPLIFTYFKEESDDINSDIEEFKEKIDKLGHFYALYKNNDDLNYKFDQQIDRLADEGYIEFDTLNWKKVIRYTIIFLIIPLILLISAYSYLNSRTPFNMTVITKEKNPVPGCAFKEGDITLVFEDKQEKKTITNETVFKQIPGNLRGEKANLIFEASGFRKIDTTITLCESVTLPVCRDNSLSEIIGIIIDEDGVPVPGAKVSVLDIKSFTDEMGKFKIVIPYEKQNINQTLIIFKKGYRVWQKESAVIKGFENQVTMEKLKK